MPRCAEQMPPHPMMPRVISSEGGVWPLSPRTRLGRIWMVASAASDLMDWRRVIMVICGLRKTEWCRYRQGAGDLSRRKDFPGGQGRRSGRLARVRARACWCFHAAILA